MKWDEYPDTWTRPYHYWRWRGLSVRAANVLAWAGVTSDAELVAMSPREIRKLKNCGPKTYPEIVALRELTPGVTDVQPETLAEQLSRVTSQH